MMETDRASFNQMQSLIQNGRHEKSDFIKLEKLLLEIFFSQKHSVVYGTKIRTHNLGPEIGYSLFATEHILIVKCTD